MKLIPTTVTAVEKIKSEAKRISRAESISHLTTLERAAKVAGYDSWFHAQWCLKQSAAHGAPSNDPASEEAQFVAEARSYMAYLARKGAVPVTAYQAKGDVFHEVEIEGVCFRGAIGIDGPAIIRRSARLRGYEQGWVQLGVAEIHHVPRFSPYIARAQQQEPIGHQWWVCKYGPREERIKIDDLSEAGLHALAHEFGIVLKYPVRDHKSFDADLDTMHFFGGEWFLFYLSPAFRSLCQWAKKHPRKAKDGQGHYAGDWVKAALAGEYSFRDE